jgi:putative tricarboxylic transport membrane protein
MLARTWDLTLGLVFATAGIALAVVGWRLPEGVAGIPGPGFFPMLIGGALAALGCALAVSAQAAEGVYWEHGWRHPYLQQALLVILLLATYAALWNAVPFAVRTPVLLVALYRVFRVRWPLAVLVAVVTTGVLGAIFTLLLRVRL